jgi:hypothetical protein
MNYKTMKERFQLMLDKKAVLSETWKTTERELSTLEKQLLDLQTYLDQQLPRQEESKDEQEQPAPKNRENSNSL